MEDKRKKQQHGGDHVSAPTIRSDLLLVFVLVKTTSSPGVGREGRRLATHARAEVEELRSDSVSRLQEAGERAKTSSFELREVQTHRDTWQPMGSQETRINTASCCALRKTEKRCVVMMQRQLLKSPFHVLKVPFSAKITSPTFPNKQPRG